MGDNGSGDSGMVVLCERALPGERLIARILKRSSSHAEAYKLQSLTPHADIVDPPCPHFGPCGGCRLQNLAYAAQLAHKETQVRDLFTRMGGFDANIIKDVMLPTVGCGERIYAYRNKMEFSFGTSAWTEKPPPKRSKEEGGSGTSERGFALGLHAPGRFDRILPISKCLLQDDVANGIFSFVEEYTRSQPARYPAYDAREHTGFLRHLMIRRGSDARNNNAPQHMVNIVTAYRDAPAVGALAKGIATRFPTVTSIVNNTTSTLSGVAMGEEEFVEHGSAYITETLRGLRFEVSANSFFQTNTVQADVLYSLVEQACELKGGEVLLDLFCGTGTIGLSMASRCARVYGYEIVPSAVADAQRNANRNNITNAEFRVADLAKVAAEIGTEVPVPDIVIADPNRPGMTPKLLSFLAECGAHRIVYVSCNPATQARDVATLCGLNKDGSTEGNYKLASLRAIDMFPHTPHVETIAVLNRR
eukprot:jgi/Chlat1/6839/Chrsp51S09105